MKPKNKASLLRYLALNPYMMWTHPGMGAVACATIPTARKFVRMQGGRLVILTHDGKESHLQVTAKQLSFDDKGFNVTFGAEWGNMAGRSMRYDYIDESTYSENMPKQLSEL